MILTVAGETESVDFDGFWEVDFDPRLLFGVLSGGGFPDHRAIFAIVGFFNGRAFLKHFRRLDEGRSGVLMSEIFAEVSGAEDFEFIDKDFWRTELDTEFFSSGVWESHVTVSPPIFFPESDALAKGFSFSIELWVNFGGPFFSRVVFLEFGDATTKFYTLEDRGERIVILDRDGIELVVMAAGAAHGDAHHGGSNCLHDFINPVSARLPDGGWFASDGGGWDVRASNQKPGSFADAELISGELFGDELIVRGVVVKGANHVVAVKPGIFPVEVGFGAVCFGPADDVEPMLCPPFSEVSRFELGVKEIGIGFFGVVLESLFKIVNLFGSRRKTGDGDVDALDE